ncbi:MAG TPA: hypothetical protein VI874_04695, partial [Candidatus Norongarragalinales archaeon]|nr:hypothetical protein [Candidatus Norongarragalinales archaeon]
GGGLSEIVHEGGFYAGKANDVVTTTLSRHGQRWKLIHNDRESNLTPARSDIDRFNRILNQDAQNHPENHAGGLIHVIREALVEALMDFAPRRRTPLETSSRN